MSRPVLIAGLAALIVIVARPALAADAKQMEENKKTVAAFYDAVLNQKDFDAASNISATATPSTIPTPPTDPRASRASSTS